MERVCANRKRSWQMVQVGIRERVSMRRHAGISQLLRRVALTDEARRWLFPAILRSMSKASSSGSITTEVTNGWASSILAGKEAESVGSGVPVTAQCRGRIER